MVDDPYNTNEAAKNNVTKRCRTLEADCQDCRKTDLGDIYTAHFTVCGKPFYCSNGATWEEKKTDHVRLCMELFREWHLVRRGLEDEWKQKYPGYSPVLFEKVNETKNFTRYQNFRQGHCKNRTYIPMEYPSLFANDSTSGNFFSY